MNEHEEVGVLSGWGIAPSALVDFFPAGARVLFPTRENVVELSRSSRLVGYSLGAWLLLDAASRGEISCKNVTLYAPFLAFPREASKGGRVALTQIKFLRRWLRKDPVAAITDFYNRAALSFPRTEEIPYAIDALDTGLELLAEGFVARVPAIAQTWEIVLGENDALLDVFAVAKTFSENSLRIVSSGTHDLLTLL